MSPSPTATLDPLDQVRALLARVESARVRQRVEKTLALWELGYVREALSQFRVTCEEVLRRLAPLCPGPEAGDLERDLERGRAAAVIERLHHELEVIPARVGLQLHTLLAWGNYASHHQKRGHQARGADLLVLVSIAVDLEDWAARSLGGAQSLLAPERPGPEAAGLPGGLDRVDRLLSRSCPGRLRREPHRLAIPDLSLELYHACPGEPPPPEEPYRGLRSFELEDAGRFYGRARLVAELEQSVDTRRLTLLSGASGAGKTSLLRAGLLPLLLDLGCGVVCLTDYSDEALALLLEIREAWGSRPLVMVLDQLERALLPGADQGALRAVLTLLAGVGRQTQGRRVVVGIREDFLGRLLREAKLPLSDQPAAREEAEDAAAIITAGPLTAQESREAITRPLQGSGVSLEPALLSEVLLPALLQEHSDGAAPARLQIVCSRLYEAARSSGGEMDLALYRRLGGADEILGSYLDKALASGRYEGEEAQARALLKAMTGPQLRRWVGLGELWQRLATEADLPSDEVQLRSLLTRLMDDRLVVSRGEGPLASTRYSLMHDQLAGIVGSWRSAAELERQDAQDRLDRALLYYAGDRDRGELLRGRGLRLVERHFPRLRREGGAAVELLAASRRGRFLRRLSVGLLLGAALLGVLFGVVQLRRAVNARDAAARLADPGVMLHARQDLARDPTRAAAWLRNLTQPTSGIAGLALLEEARQLGVARVLTGHRDVVASVAFSPDGMILASGSRDGTVRLYAAPTGRGLGVMGRHGAGVQSVAFSPDGETLASGGGDGVVRLYEVKGRRLRGTGGGAGGGVEVLSFSPDGGLLAWAGEDPHVTLWSMTEGKVWRKLPRAYPAGRVLSLAHAPDGNGLAAGDSRGVLSRWSVRAGGDLGHHQRTHQGGIYGLAYSPDGRALASAGLDSMLHVRPAAVGDETFTRRHQLSHRALALAYTPDGKTLAWAGAGKEVRFLKRVGELLLEREPPLRGHLGAIHDLAISPDGRLLATASRDNTVRLYDLSARRGATRAGHTHLKGHPGKQVWAAAFSPDGRTLLSAGTDGEVRQWDAEGASGQTASWRHGKEAFALSLSPDGKRMVSAGWGGEVRLLSRERPGQVLASAQVGTGAIYAVAHAPGRGQAGRVVALGGSDGQVHFLSAADLKPMTGRPPLSHPGALLALRYTRDGQSLITGCRDGLVRVWDPTQVRLRGEALRGHGAAVYSLAISPDGARLATGGGDATIRLWDLSAPRALGKPLAGHHGWVLSLDFSPDGQTLASGSSDGTIRFWDTRANRPLGPPLHGHQDWVHVLAFSPDGKTLASGSADGTIWLWRLGQARLSSLVRRVDAMTNLNVSPRGRVSYRW